MPCVQVGEEESVEPPIIPLLLAVLDDGEAVFVRLPPPPTAPASSLRSLKKVEVIVGESEAGAIVALLKAEFVAAR